MAKSDSSISRLRAYIAALRSGDAMAYFLLADLETVLDRAEAAQEWAEARASVGALGAPERNIDEASARFKRLNDAERRLREGDGS